MRTFVIWEPVLFTDWSAPSAATLGRISSTHADQFWDKGRLVSRSLGEHDRRSIVWDNIAVYPVGAVWEDRLPQPLYHGGPVVGVLDEAHDSLVEALKAANAKTAKED